MYNQVMKNVRLKANITECSDGVYARTGTGAVKCVYWGSKIGPK